MNWTQSLSRSTDAGQKSDWFILEGKIFFFSKQFLKYNYRYTLVICLYSAVKMLISLATWVEITYQGKKWTNYFPLWRFYASKVSVNCLAWVEYKRISNEQAIYNFLNLTICEVCLDNDCKKVKRWRILFFIFL